MTDLAFQIPIRISFLRFAAIVTALYTAFWISLEGHLGRAILLAAAVVIVLALYCLQRLLGGRKLSLSGWLTLSCFSGIASGGLVGPLTLLAMVLKTGLHAHGPEFSAADVAWVLDQIPLWAVVGALTGLGMGLTAAAVQKG